jgi:nitroreductase
MLLNHLQNRYTAKWWNDQQIESGNLEAIIKCAYLAPSKQGNYDFEIVVLTDSPTGKEFKQWLYWDNTTCLDKVRGKPGEGLRRYNGQVLAPIVMIWLAKQFEQPLNDYSENEFLRTNNDCIISATMAMCQAEELGINTGFCGCLGGREIADRLNKPNSTAIVSIGFGYATSHNTSQTIKVYNEDVEMGFDLANHHSSIRNIPTRVKRPDINSMVNYI